MDTLYFDNNNIGNGSVVGGHLDMSARAAGGANGTADDILTTANNNTERETPKPTQHQNSQAQAEENLAELQEAEAVEGRDFTI